MTSSTQYFTSPFYKVGAGYSVSFSLKVHQDEKEGPAFSALECSWNPNIPTKKEFERHKKIATKYYMARNSFLASISKKTANNLFFVDL